MQEDLNSEKVGDVAPLVSVGIPVFNGENFLEEAIQSILAQTLKDFELILFDNASTDRTEEIGRKYAALDSRVSYHRNPENLGAAANYDLCFNHARGKYFKWAAHDDMIAPDFLERLVRGLEAHPDCIHGMAGIRAIDQQGEYRREYQQTHLKGNQPEAWKRFYSAFCKKHNCVDFFGVFRRDALVGSQLHGNYVSSDRVFLSEMALRGKTYRIADLLFIHREHDDRSVKMAAVDRIAWWDPSRQGKRSAKLILSTMLWNALKAVRRSAPSLKDEFICYGVIVKQIVSKNYRSRLLKEWLAPFVVKSNKSSA